MRHIMKSTRLLLPVCLLLAAYPLHGQTPAAQRVSVTAHGAVGDGTTINTAAIQKTIDTIAAGGGGTVEIPEGVFMSGALFLKPGVNLHLAKGAVLRCPTDMKHFPAQRTRIEGHFEENFNPALINADACDGLQITGEGTLDGAGRPIWDKFWKSIKADRKFKNLDLPRARLCLLENSKNVTVRGITFKDSQFWNLHLYNCDKVLVEKARFEVPDDYKQAPSSDGVDVDSCRNVVIRDCWFSVTDDCIALKGTKGPFALEDKSSPPVENVRVTDCVFKRGHQAVSCGSEATIVRNIVIENCTVKGSMPLFRGKLRTDTPQRYENITFRNITFENGGASIFAIAPWTQYFDLKGQPAPSSVLKGLTVSGVNGELGSFGSIGGHDKAAISDITLENVDVKAKNMRFKVSDKVKNLRMHNVKVNGAPYP